MKTVRRPAAHLKGLEPYDPKYLPARLYLNANENPYGMPPQARAELIRMLETEPLHRYPDPLAKRLRIAVADKLGLEPENILLGNGGDELIFDLCLAYGGMKRRLLITPPTFSVYATDAQLTYTDLVEIARATGQTPAGFLDFSIDEAAVLAQLKGGAVDLVMLTSPNNPTGDCLSLDFIEAVLAATDAVVLMDQAYIEFSDPQFDVCALLSQHANLAILRTFSKAYGLAGMRIGYLLAGKEIMSQLYKVRQPYSVDAGAALAALAALAEAREVQSLVESIKAERTRLIDRLGPDGLGLALTASEANFVLVKIPQAHKIWQQLYDEYGILVRDLSQAAGLEDCLRITIGTPEENDELVQALRALIWRQNWKLRIKN